MRDLHHLAIARLPAYRFGVLDAATTQEVREHLRACADCGAAFEPFAELSSEEEDGRLGHVPLALLARWDLSAAQLPAVERALLEAHLAGCGSCSESLKFSRRMRATPMRTRWRSRFGWIAGTGAAMVAAFLVVLLRGPTIPPHPPAEPARAPEKSRIFQPGYLGTTTAPAPRRREPSRSAIVELGRATRGGAGQVVRVPAGTTTVPLRVPPLLGVGPDARIRIDVTGPGGAMFGHAEIDHRRLFGEAPPPVLEATTPDGSALPAGHYEVTAVSDAPDPALPGGFERADYGFELQFLADPVAP